MKHILIAVAAWVLCPTPIHAQEFSGSARAVDGDTLNMTGLRIRLHGLDAPEAAQTCHRAEAAWECGKEAGALLASLVEGKTVRCVQQDLDDYGRVVAICTIGRLDLADAIVSAGLAIALPQYSQAYIESEARARSLKVGLWGSEFMTPAAYRAAHNITPAANVRPAQAEVPTTRPSSNGVYYRNCDAARAAGAAPLRRGQPGYRVEMDGDRDGIACEPYRGRR